MKIDSSNEESSLIERYKFTVSYNGTAFSGFQRQGETRTVQLELEKALKKLGWKEESITGAGRTDSGVHAAGQVISAALDWHHGEEQLRNAMNAALPPDLAVLQVERAENDFNARYDAMSRTYHYQIYFSPVRLPLRDEFSWRIWPALDLEKLNRISRHFTGVHDFRAFGSPPRKNHSTVREIFRNGWEQQSNGTFCFVIEANAFLYHMVRRIVFLQTAYARESVTEEEIIRAVRYGIDAKPGLAPARGLQLWQVRYPEPGKESEIKRIYKWRE
ncbi:MAG: tRNA pseudouridine(38-40) synthase TruA [Anaerolineaceae bacterium]|nr:tRNA pseudouridine(38-40) synthase TruA [Anaerolineaceae bacterium]